MKFLDLRKYIFANITAIVGYIPIIVTIIYNMYPHEPFNPDNLINEDIIIVFAITVCMQIVLFTFILILLEIIIRKFFIEKKFPNFKINIKLNLPKYLSTALNIIYTVLFYFGIFISSLLFIGALLIIIE